MFVSVHIYRRPPPIISLIIIKKKLTKLEPINTQPLPLTCLLMPSSHTATAPSRDMYLFSILGVCNFHLPSPLSCFAAYMFGKFHCLPPRKKYAKKNFLSLIKFYALNSLTSDIYRNFFCNFGLVINPLKEVPIYFSTAPPSPFDHQFLIEVDCSRSGLSPFALHTDHQASLSV